MERHSDLEDLLSRLEPARPRKELREALLADVGAALAREGRPGWLCRPLPWVAAAALLGALLLAGPLVESAQVARLSSAAALPPSPAALDVANLLPPGNARRLILARMRSVEIAALERSPHRRRWVEHVIRMHERGATHG